MPAAAPASPRISFVAPRSEVARWLKVAGTIAVLLLLTVAVLATLRPADDYSASSSGLVDPHGTWSDVGRILKANGLVLALHFFAASAGAIIGRGERDASGTRTIRSRFGTEVLPAWIARVALAWALGATLLSVSAQAWRLGTILADLAAQVDAPPPLVLLLVLPHALPELCAVFLPLGLFLTQARRDDLAPLVGWIWHALALAAPALVVCAVIEVWVSRPLLQAVLQ